MVASQKIGMRIDQLQSEIDKLDADLSMLPGKAQKEKATLRSNSLREFESKKAKRLAAIPEAIAKKREEVSALLDTFPGLETKEVAGKYEIQDLEDHLMEIYPRGLVEDYICLNPLVFEDDSEAYQVYSSVEETIIGLGQNNLAGAIFSGLSSLLDTAAENTGFGAKIALVVLAVLVGTLILSPFLFLFIFSVLGVVGAVQGIVIRGSLRKLYSVKLYLNNAYDEDIFAQDKGDIMASVDSFLVTAEEQYREAVESEVYHFDESLFQSIDKQLALDKQRLESAKDLKNQELVTRQQELEAIIKKLEELEEQERKYSELARKKFMGEITWNKEWLSQIFLDVTPEHKVKVMPFAKGNSLYYSRDINSLKNLSRLVVFQSMIQMHPDFSCSFVLDYKYNGGDVAQFVNTPKRILNVCYSEDDLQKQSEFISNEIRLRTSNILGTCQSIEDYNKLMAEYGSSGEYYVVVHIMGLNSFSSQLLSNIRNGPRVGYFYKIYCTTEELQELSEDFPLSDMQEIFEVLENPMPRTIGAVQRLLNSST